MAPCKYGATFVTTPVVQLASILEQLFYGNAQSRSYIGYLWGRDGAIAETEKKKFVFAPDPELT